MPFDRYKKEIFIRENMKIWIDIRNSDKPLRCASCFLYVDNRDCLKHRFALKSEPNKALIDYKI